MTHIDLPSIWLLERLDKSAIGYDEYLGFTIVAETEAEARNLAAFHHANEGSTIWLSPALSSCTLLGIANDPTPRILLDSFNAG
jgi:hypothetical protein